MLNILKERLLLLFWLLVCNKEMITVCDQSVAERFIEELPELEVSKELERGLVSTFQYMHQSVVAASELYLQVCIICSNIDNRSTFIHYLYIFRTNAFCFQWITFNKTKLNTCTCNIKEWSVWLVKDIYVDKFVSLLLYLDQHTLDLILCW